MLVLLAVGGALLSAPTARATETSPYGEIRVSQSAPDPTLEAVDSAGATTAGEGSEVLGRRAKRAGCASGYRWMGLCTFAGYKLPKCGQSRCGLLGAFVLGRTKAYRTDLDAGAKTGGLKTASRIQASAKRKARCGWNSTRGAQAAYLLSRYGAVGANNREAAAVDMAKDHLVCGRRWRLGGKTANARLRQTGVSGSTKKAIKRRAAALVAASSRQAGPYRVTVASGPASPGSPVTVRATIVSRTGAAAPNRLVRMTLPNGGGTTDAFTNSAGVATWTFTMPSGSATATVTAPALEEYRLVTRKSKSKKGPRVFLAGQTYAASSKVVVTSKQRPTLTVSAANATIPAGFTGSVSYGNSLGSETKDMTFQLRGPFSSNTTASCSSGSLAYSARMQVSGNAGRALPGAAPKVAGYYRWRVVVAEDSVNAAAEACSNPVYMYPAAASISASTMNPTTDTKIKVGSEIKPANFTYTGSYGPGGRQVTVVLWGPFDTKSQASCAAGAARQARVSTWGLSANGKYTLIKPGQHVTIGARSNAGWYRFGVNVAGNSSNRAASVCGPKFQVVP